METNKIVKKLRKEAKLTQEQLATIIGLKRTTYANAEKNNAFKIGDLKKIAHHFNISLSSIIDEENFVQKRILELSNNESDPNILRQPESDFYKSDDGVDVSIITNNERQLIKFYRVADSDEKKLILDLAKKLGTK